MASSDLGCGQVATVEEVVEVSADMTPAEVGRRFRFGRVDSDL
jgi:hypothetical protein